MAIFRSIKTLIFKTQKNPKALKPFSNSFISYPTRNSSLLSRSKSFPVNNTTPFHSHSLIIGPLFLSSTPYCLSQSATPLLLQSDAVLSFLKIKALTLLHNNSNFLLVDHKKSKNDSVTEFKQCSDKSEGVAKRVEIRDNFVNLPNFISLSRLLSGPLLGWLDIVLVVQAIFPAFALLKFFLEKSVARLVRMITQEMYSLAFIGLGISGATDWLDGYVARKMGINSVVGSYLDPLADKVLIGCVALSMVENGLLHPGLVALVVLRDVALVGGAVYKRASSLGWEWKSWSDFFNLDGTRPEKVEPLFLSKVNTVFQLILVAAALLQPEFGNEASQSYITYLSWLVASTTISSTVAYGAQHLRRSSSLAKIHR